MRRSAIVTTALVLSATLSGCSNPDSQKNTTVASTDSSATLAAKLEDQFQNDAERNAEFRAEARHAVLDFVKANLSGWNVTGMASQAFYGNVFSIDADLEKDGHHVVITVEARKFFPESSDPYWLAVPVNTFRRDRLHTLNDDDLFKKLKKAQAELEELRSPPPE